MKTVDTTKFTPPLIGNPKEMWVFKCSFCSHIAFFILYKGTGMSTGCEKCHIGDMERGYMIKKMEEK